MTVNPETLNITPEILSLIAELDEFKGAWRAMGILAPERLSALRRVATKVFFVAFLRFAQTGPKKT